MKKDIYFKINLSDSGEIYVEWFDYVRLLDDDDYDVLKSGVPDICAGEACFNPSQAILDIVEKYVESDEYAQTIMKEFQLINS